MNDDQYQHHAHQLVRIADMMESCSDDDSKQGVRFYRQLQKDYKIHMDAMKILKPENFPKI